MWKRNKTKELNSIALLYANGGMKPLLTWMAREVIQANTVLDTSLDMTELIKAQERKRLLKEIMRLGKKARKAQNK